MRTRAFLLALIVWLAPAWASAQVLDTGTITAASTSCLATNCVDQALAGIETVAIGVQGTFVGTIEVEVSNDRGDTWAAWTVLQQTDRTLDEEITTTGLWLGGNAGYTHMRVRASAWTSGSASDHPDARARRRLGAAHLLRRRRRRDAGRRLGRDRSDGRATTSTSNPLAVTLTDTDGNYHGLRRRHAVRGRCAARHHAHRHARPRDSRRQSLDADAGRRRCGRPARGFHRARCGSRPAPRSRSSTIRSLPTTQSSRSRARKSRWPAAIRDDALATLAAAEGDAVPLRVNDSGRSTSPTRRRRSIRRSSRMPSSGSASISRASGRAARRRSRPGTGRSTAARCASRSPATRPASSPASGRSARPSRRAPRPRISAKRSIPFPARRIRAWRCSPSGMTVSRP